LARVFRRHFFVTVTLRPSWLDATLEWPPVRWKTHDDPVERAMRTVAREQFVPAELRAQANADVALPIGRGQTISQPSLVAYMTRQLQLAPHSRVLEVGTGSGFQAAVLAQLAREVYSVERIPELGVEAQQRLDALGYRNIHFRIGDGCRGWAEAAPFDAIIVTAAAPRLAPAWLEQLATPGRIVVPLEEADSGGQDLWLIEKDKGGALRESALMGVRFVPLIADE
jgi:protein-L-isoaspartate(D-aspartate) O-methyltransferase